MIYVLNKFQPNPYPQALEVDTTSKGQFKKDLSPFYLGPVEWIDPVRGSLYCRRFENFWQYTKVYPEYADVDSNPTELFYKWQEEGFNSYRANRYPMGKGRKPLYSLLNGQRYNYLFARREIYAPTYAALVLRTRTYAGLKELVEFGMDIVLRDFDGYDYVSMGRSLMDVINDPDRKMGHAFVLAMLLSNVKVKGS